MYTPFYKRFQKQKIIQPKFLCARQRKTITFYFQPLFRSHIHRDVITLAQLLSPTTLMPTGDACPNYEALSDEALNNKYNHERTQLAQEYIKMTREQHVEWLKNCECMKADATDITENQAA